MSQIDRPIRPRRSLLFVPGLRPDRFVKALDSGADIVCVDMEDAVALPRKDEGRTLTLPLFKDRSHPHVETMARINSIQTVHGLKDLQALIESDAPPPSIMIPKVKSAEEIQLIDTLLSAGPAREIRFCVIIETNQGLERAIEIAKSSSRIDSMILGAVDMSAELRCQKSWEPLLYTRSRLVHAAAYTDPADVIAERAQLRPAAADRHAIGPGALDRDLPALRRRVDPARGFALLRRDVADQGPELEGRAYDERRVAEEVTRAEGKPEAALPKIVEGRLNGWFKENVLLEQAFAKDNSKTVGKVVEEAGGEVTSFARFRVGA